MARDKNGIPFHPPEYNPDFPRIKCKLCGLMNSCEHDLRDVEPWYPRLPILLEGGMVESIDDFVLHPYTEWSLQKIVDAQVKNHKLVIENFLHPELFYNCIQNWPMQLDAIDVVGRTQKDISFNDIYQMLFDKVLNDEYLKCAIADKFSLENEFSASAWLWEDTEKFTVNDVHVDFDQFDVTFGLYMPSDPDALRDYGTQFWKPNVVVDDLNKSLIRENCTLIDQIPFIPNIVYFMPRSNNSWHSSPILDKPMRRKHVYGYYSSV
jgi:hypothetical protein